MEELLVEKVPSPDDDSLVPASINYITETDYGQEVLFDEAPLKEGETKVPSLINYATETDDSQELDLAIVRSHTILGSEKGQANVSHMDREFLTSSRVTRLEQDNVRNPSSANVSEQAGEDLSTKASGFHTTTREKESKKDGNSLLLHGRVSLTSFTEQAQTGKRDEIPALITQGSRSNTILHHSMEVWPTEEQSMDGREIQNLDILVTSKDNPGSSSYIQEKPTTEYISKSFTCDSNPDDEDEQLREHWMRTLQTSSSTGEIVEEIVRVLKHQKSHDLLCPVCGSCITKRVVLRKRKRSSRISVDRWYREEGAEEQVKDSMIEIRDTTGEQEDLQEYSHMLAVSEQDGDTEAFGCLACFSLFFLKVQDFWKQDKAESEREPFSCFPFFFPPYPWGLNQSKKYGMIQPSDRKDAASEVVSAGEAFQISTGSEEIDINGTSRTEQSEGRLQVWADQSISTCGLAPVLLPDYPWGYSKKEEEMSQSSDQKDAASEVVSAGEAFQSSAGNEEIALNVTSHTEQSEGRVQVWADESISTCGLAPALLPDYPWGYSKKEDAVTVQKKDNLTKHEPEAKVLKQEYKSMTEVQELDSKFTSADLPAYSWGNVTRYEEITEDVPILRIRCEENDDGRTSNQNGIHVMQGMASAICPPYPWGTYSVTKSDHERNGGHWYHSFQGDRQNASTYTTHADENSNNNGDVSKFLKDSDIDCSCGLGPAILPKYPWGKFSEAADFEERPAGKEIKEVVEQESKIESHFTTELDTVKYLEGGTLKGRPLKDMVFQQTSQIIESVHSYQTVTVLKESTTELNESLTHKIDAIQPLASLPSTGFASEGLANKDISGTGVLTSGPSTGYALLEDLGAIAQSSLEETPEIREKPVSGNKMHPVSEQAWTSFSKGDKMRTQNKPIGWQFSISSWYSGQVTSDDLKKPLLKTPVEPKQKKFSSVLKPSVSVFKASKPSDDGNALAPPQSILSKLKQKIIKGTLTAVEGPPQDVAEAVIQVESGDLVDVSVGTGITTPDFSARTEQTDGWDILRPIVYGGLDISIASLGITSSAAGGDAITRTVVYMGLATLLSGLFGFYHNVMNLYHHYRQQFSVLIGKTLFLHGTVALISYFLFGVLSPLTYALSFRDSDDRDQKFILCCVVALVSVILLSWGKAHVTNKLYIKTVLAYIFGGFMASIVGYLAGEHIAELLESWGF